MYVVILPKYFIKIQPNWNKKCVLLHCFNGVYSSWNIWCFITKMIIKIQPNWNKKCILLQYLTGIHLRWNLFCDINNIYFRIQPNWNKSVYFSNFSPGFTWVEMYVVILPYLPKRSVFINTQYLSEKLIKVIYVPGDKNTELWSNVTYSVLSNNLLHFIIDL